MTSRYFTKNCPELAFNGEGLDGSRPDYTEVTDDGRKLTHFKDGSVRDGSAELKVTALEACVGYVQRGAWVEIAFDDVGQRYQVSSDAPVSSYGDTW